MENIHKYFAIIEKLEEACDLKNEQETIKSNYTTIQKFIKDDIGALSAKESLKSINYNLDSVSENDLIWNYASYLFHILLTVKNQVNLNSDKKEDLISEQQKENLINCFAIATKYAVNPNILPEFQNNKIFEFNFKDDKIQKKLNLNRLNICVNFLKQMYEINYLLVSNRIDEVKLLSMAAAFSILSAPSENSNNKINTEELLLNLWNHSCKVNYFRNLLIMKSSKNLGGNVQKILHEDLLSKLQNESGFKVLLEAIVPKSNIDAPNWKCFEVVANIISHKSHSDKFYDNLIEQIFSFLRNATAIEHQHSYIPGGVLSLRKLYLLQNKSKEKILSKINDVFKNLYEPADLVSGSIICENNELYNFLKFLSFLFCGSSQQSLPSEILIEYMPILIEIYQQIPENFKQTQLIKSIIVQCLSNRKENELNHILNQLMKDNFENFKILHPRITFNVIENINFVSLICSSESNKHNIIPGLCRVLKNSNNNMLIYNSFICVLRLFEDENFEETNVDDSTCLLQDVEELNSFFDNKFKFKFAVISFLTDLIEFKPLHSQFKENSSELVEFVKTTLSKSFKCEKPSADKLSIILAIFQEIIENSNNIDTFQNIIPLVKNYLRSEKTLSLNHQLENILQLLEGNEINKNKTGNSFEKSEFEIARCLIEENQSYLRVYGLNMMTKLVNQKDTEAINKKHAVLAIALHALKDEESYTFLNCVKLFVALINTLETDVIDVLSDEYLSDNNETDYRLKIGEVILKVTEDLGPISYKYKSTLINCFMNGSRHPVDEIRLSSISNLAVICRLLTYQVQTIFQEILQLIESILQTEKYLPVKRAAVLVLSQLLAGMDNLLDFQEFLLPIYRILKYIAANDADAIMRVHANNGLNILNMKCKKLLLSVEKIEKEIRIFGIKDEENKPKKSGFILELN